MTQLRVRIGEADKPQPNLIWDSVWLPQEGYADWALAGPTETQNSGGLQAQKALHSAIALALFSDKRVPDDHPHKKFIGDANPGGWWGDDIDVRADLGETALGSLLWIYARAPLTDEIGRFVQIAAQEALKPLLDQGAAARIEVDVTVFEAFDRLEMDVRVYGRDGTKIYDMKFADLWAQVTQL